MQKSAIMKNDVQKKMEAAELKQEELVQTSGGLLLPLLVAVGVYLIYDVAGNPQASYDAFMRGWNAIKNG